MYDLSYMRFGHEICKKRKGNARTITRTCVSRGDVAGKMDGVGRKRGDVAPKWVL
jgi:hypothetical protein